jgi:hypothetical protein
MRQVLAPHLDRERACSGLGRDQENDGGIRRGQHSPSRLALGAVASRMRNGGEIDATASLQHGGPRAGSSMRHQGIAGVRRDCAMRQQKNRRPGQGTSGVKLVVPPHFATAWNAIASPRTTRQRVMRRLGNGSRFTLLGARRRLLRHSCYMPVRDGARRSFSPAFLVPLHSDRGSLARSSRLLVLIIASVFSSPRTLSESRLSVNISRNSPGESGRRSVQSLITHIS